MAERTRTGPREMLDEPALSRQWVLRRLQKILSADLAVAAMLDGIVRTAKSEHRETLRPLARQTADRARLVRGRIEAEGGRPYSSVGLARRLSRLGGRVLGFLGPWSWRPILRWSLEQSYAELDALAALTRSVEGIDPATAHALEPEVDKARAALAKIP